MEAANVVLVPAIAFGLAWPDRWPGAVAMGVATVAAAGFLIVGTLFWRGLDRRMSGRGRQSIAAAVRSADRAERPLVAITAAAAFATLAALLAEGTSASVIAAGLLTLLAALEYVNYYHRQLQVFDNWPDLHRLFATRRFKRAHLSRELDSLRRRRA